MKIRPSKTFNLARFESMRIESRKKVFFVEYRIHLRGGDYAYGDIERFWWGGTKDELVQLKNTLPEIAGIDSQTVRHVEIMAMFECFGEPAE